MALSLCSILCTVPQIHVIRLCRACLCHCNDGLVLFKRLSTYLLTLVYLVHIFSLPCKIASEADIVQFSQLPLLRENFYGLLVGGLHTYFVSLIDLKLIMEYSYIWHNYVDNILNHILSSTFFHKTPSYEKQTVKQ